MDINDLRQERSKLHADMRGMLDEHPVLDADKSAEYDRMENRFDELTKSIKRMEANESREREIMAATPKPINPGKVVDGDGKPIKGDPFADHPRASKEYKDAFWAVARRGNRADAKFRNALEVGTDSEGGYAVPLEYDTRLVVALEQYNEIRQYATVITTSSERKIPIETDDGTAAYVDEEAAYPEDDPAFGQITLDAYKMGKIIKVSEELLQDAFFDIPNYIAGVFGRVFGYREETAFVNGSGSGEPTGIVGGSQLGVTAAGAAAITSDEIIDLYHSLKRPYRRNAHWLMADLTVKLVRKLKTSEGQYLWQPGLQADEPDRILGRPLIISDAMPAATTGLKSVVFGDLAYYTIADRAGRQMQRLNELYAATGQIGFRMWERHDGKVVLAEAFKHLIQA